MVSCCASECPFHHAPLAAAHPPLDAVERHTSLWDAWVAAYIVDAAVQGSGGRGGESAHPGCPAGLLLVVLLLRVRTHNEPSLKNPALESGSSSETYT